MTAAASQPCRTAAGKSAILSIQSRASGLSSCSSGTLAPNLSAMSTASANVRSDSPSLAALPRGPLAPYEGLIRAFEPYRRSTRLSVKKCPREQPWKLAPSVVLLEGTKREMDKLCEVEQVMTEIRDDGHKQFAIAPSATGTIARLAYARAKKAGIALPPLLSQSGLTIAQIENRHLRLKATSQITFLGLVADALPDDLLGFHLAHDFDLREIGLLYYVMASSEMLDEALRRAARYSRIVNEGMSAELLTGRSTTFRLKYVGVARHSDRHQVEFWLTTIIRICRQLTTRRLAPSRVRIVHRQKGERPQLEAFFGCKVEFSAGADEIVLT